MYNQMSLIKHNHAISRLTENIKRNMTMAMLLLCNSLYSTESAGGGVMRESEKDRQGALVKQARADTTHRAWWSARRSLVHGPRCRCADDDATFGDAQK